MFVWIAGSLAGLCLVLGIRYLVDGVLQFLALAALYTGSVARDNNTNFNWAKQRGEIFFGLFFITLAVAAAVLAIIVQGG